MGDAVGQIVLPHEAAQAEQRCIQILPGQPHAFRSDVDADFCHGLAQFLGSSIMHHRPRNEAEADGLAVQELDAGAGFQCHRR